MGCVELLLALALALVAVFVLVGELEMGSVAVPVVEDVDVDVDDAVWFVILLYFTQHWMLFGPGQGQGYYIVSVSDTDNEILRFTSCEVNTDVPGKYAPPSQVWFEASRQ